MQEEFISDAVVRDVISDRDFPPIEEVIITDEGWEHKVVVMNSDVAEFHEEQLNLLARVNWQLVHVRVINRPFDNEVWYYLKRERQVNDELSTIE